jgi:DnaK suppressor protein
MDVEKAKQENEVLLAERQKLQDDIELLKETLRGEVDVDVEEGDPDVIEREKSLALLSALESRLASIEDALKAIERGNYGICQRCGKPISAERLEVKPEATLCITCQAEVERLKRRGIYTPRRANWGM